MTTRRVAFLLNSLVIGGAETQALELARHLRPLGWEAVFLVMERRGALLDRVVAEGFTVHSIHAEFHRPKRSPGFWKNLLRCVLRIQRHCRHEHCHVLQSFLFWENVLAVPAAVLSPQIRAVVTCRLQLGTHKEGRPHYQPIENLCNAFTGAVVANARSVARDCLRRERHLRGRLRVIHNGVDHERFSRAAPADADALFPRETARAFTVACVANLRAIKRHDVLVRAVGEAVRQGANVRAVLVGENRGEEAALRALAGELGIAGRVAFTGGVADPAPWYAAADACALTSDHEGLPNGVLEAMAAGRPVLATAVGGIPELVVEGRTGHLVPAGDWRALAERMVELAGDRDRARRMGEAGRRRARRRFSNERLAGEHAALYQALLETGRPPKRSRGTAPAAGN
jgi:glycosyltransferase involved in cell wall biosynthesis